jgi:hypothetical protein
MPTGPIGVDAAVLRVLLRRLTELSDEANGVTDAVLGHLPDAGPGLAETTVIDLSSGLVESFSALADSLSETHRSVSRAGQRYVDVDLTVVRDLNRAAR